MPTIETTRSPARMRASLKYENLTPLEAALVDQIAEGQREVVAAVDRLAARAPHPALVWSIGAAILLYIVSLVALGQGIDPTLAAEATRSVLEAPPADVPLLPTEE